MNGGESTGHAAEGVEETVTDSRYINGARGGGPKGTRNGAYKHGLHTAEAVAERRALAALLQRARPCLAQ